MNQASDANRAVTPSPAAEPVSVVIRTIGRPRLLSAALASIARCDPVPAEVVVVDQSNDEHTRRVVEAAGIRGARVVYSSPPGPGIAANDGLRAASYRIVFMVDDDCVVEPNWIGVGVAAMREAPGGMVSGRVLPVGGDITRVPACRVSTEPYDYTGEARWDGLFTNNMVCPRDAMLDIGGFDERIVPASEDCELCYRWLKSGRMLRYLPELVVQHDAWRTPNELKTLYVSYYVGQGRFYAKHLRLGDLTIVRFIAEDIAGWVHSLISAAVRRTPRWADYRRGVGRGLPIGLVAGLRTAARADRTIAGRSDA